VSRTSSDGPSGAEFGVVSSYVGVEGYLVVAAPFGLHVETGLEQPDKCVGVDRPKDADKNEPYWNRARCYVDFPAGYRFRLFGGKIRAKAQLNVRNVPEDGRLQSVAVNPDGSTYACRIIAPRRFIRSLTFDL
jgi:hypothetical protein